ncbi:hypothetical protein EPA93_01615 [Ktedonosporobacter rubrisoli]|uniref:Uncharacterized protein n=1 Tax=Ktedonosporobacter rubrisoli TaxID=2509675 RepID=A0A4P6JI75_KTERU|nr:hypothetical protein [Ktedonosporobacter rubrisoli]QBD74757.1 hypothetical protein EPA93_01615 [Ktedonosporobacter rubrisoli]
MSQHDNPQKSQGMPEITEQEKQQTEEKRERIRRDVEQKPGWGKGPGAGTNIGSGDYAHPGPVNDLGTDQYTNSG